MNKGGRGTCRISAVFAALSVLLPFFVLLLTAPTNPDALLPACCQRNGQHHCMMRMMEVGADGTAPSLSPHFARLFPRCPYTPGAVQSAGNGLVWRPEEVQTFSMLPSGGAVALRDRCGPKVPAASANFKRGPPISSLSA
jgi:hypothetical protein